MNSIIITDELGGANCCKPNGMSYEIMRTRASVAFDKMVYVGDEPEKRYFVL